MREFVRKAREFIRKWDLLTSVGIFALFMVIFGWYLGYPRIAFKTCLLTELVSRAGDWLTGRREWDALQREEQEKEEQEGRQREEQEKEEQEGRQREEQEEREQDKNC